MKYGVLETPRAPHVHPSACKAFSEPHVPLPCSVGGSLLLLLHWGSHSSPPTPPPLQCHGDSGLSHSVSQRISAGTPFCFGPLSDLLRPLLMLHPTNSQTPPKDSDKTLPLAEVLMVPFPNSAFFSG